MATFLKCNIKRHFCGQVYLPILTHTDLQAYKKLMDAVFLLY